MNWRKILTISAVIAAGILVYTLYLYLGPYRKLSKGKQQLKEEIEAETSLGISVGRGTGKCQGHAGKKDSTDAGSPGGD